MKTITALMAMSLAVPCLSFADMPAPKIYKVKARVALKDVKKPEVSKSLPFHWTKNMTKPSENKEGWNEKGDDFTWNPGRGNSLIKIPLTITNLNRKNAGTPLFPSDYNELWFDYKDINPLNPCDVGIILKMNPAVLSERLGYAGNDNVIAISANAQFEPSDIIDVAGSKWKAQDRIYDIKRLLGLSFDDAWRYVKDNEIVVMKRRFHNEISHIEAIDLEFSVGTKIKGVNMRLGFSDRMKADVTLLWNELTEDVDVIKDRDKTIVRVWIGRLLREHYPGKKMVFLEEIFVHLYDQIADVLKERSLRRLVFQSGKNRDVLGEEEETNKGDNQSLSKRSEPMLMFVQTEKISSGLNRVKVNIRKLTYIYENDNTTALKKALLYVAPSNSGSDAGIRLDRVMAVKTNDMDPPLVINESDNLSLFFGRSLNDLTGNDDHVVSLKLLKYYSFDELNKGTIYNSKHPIGDEGKTNITHLQSNDNGLIVERDENKDNHLEILWIADTSAGEDTRFVLRLSDGEKFVKSGLITIKTDRGDEFRTTFKPNKMQELPGIQGRIMEIRVKMELYKGQSAIKLKDIALFRPYLHLEEEALEEVPKKAPMSVHKGDRKPIFQEIHNKSGVTASLHNSVTGFMCRHGGNAVESINWDTKVDHQKGIRGIDYLYDKTTTISYPCWLSLTFNGEHKLKYWDIYGSSQEGHVKIPIPDVFAKGEGDAMRLIKWRIDMAERSVDEKSALFPSSIFQMYLARLVNQTIGEEMMRSELLSLGINKIYPKEVNADFIAELQSGGAWLNLDTIAIDNVTNNLKVFDHPYLQILSVVAEPVQSAGQLSLPGFKGQGKALTSQLSKRWVKTGLIVFILAVLTLVWRKGLWQLLWQRIQFIMRCIWTFIEKKWAELLHGNKQKMIFWILLSGVIYLLGLITVGKGINSSFLSFGALTSFMAFRSLLWLVRPWIAKRWSSVAERMYEEAGNLYIIGFMAAMTGCALLMILQGEIIAEQLAEVGFCCFVTAVVQKVWHMGKGPDDVSED